MDGTGGTFADEGEPSRPAAEAGLPTPISRMETAAGGLTTSTTGATSTAGTTGRAISSTTGHRVPPIGRPLSPDRYDAATVQRVLSADPTTSPASGAPSAPDLGESQSTPIPGPTLPRSPVVQQAQMPAAPAPPALGPVQRANALQRPSAPVIGRPFRPVRAPGSLADQGTLGSATPLADHGPLGSATTVVSRLPASTTTTAVTTAATTPPMLLSREEAPSAAAAPPPTETAASGPGGAASGQELPADLADQLYTKIERRLRMELLLDRERKSPLSNAFGSPR